MEFSITRHGGQYQFWHTDCEKSKSGIMDEPELLEDNIKRFKCLHCSMMGVAEIKVITTGSGTLCTPLDSGMLKFFEGIDVDVDMDSRLPDE